MTTIATWSLPEGVAADSSINRIDRMKHYRFYQDHRLSDGTKIIPKLPTIVHILQAYDDFGLQVAVNNDSYVTHTEQFNGELNYSR